MAFLAKLVCGHRLPAVLQGESTRYGYWGEQGGFEEWVGTVWTLYEEMVIGNHSREDPKPAIWRSFVAFVVVEKVRSLVV